jgi:hypothetical protein
MVAVLTSEDGLAGPPAGRLSECKRRSRNFGGSFFRGVRDSFVSAGRAVVRFFRLIGALLFVRASGTEGEKGKSNCGERQ